MRRMDAAAAPGFTASADSGADVLPPRDGLLPATIEYIMSGRTAFQAFNYLDADSNGLLDLLEVAQLGEDLGLEMSMNDAKEAFKAMDSDGNGVVTRGEFKRWWNTTKEHGRRLNRRTLREVFSKLDKGGSGLIFRNEFGRLMKVSSIREQMALQNKPLDLARVSHDTCSYCVIRNPQTRT